MLPYWIMFSVVAFAAVLPAKRVHNVNWFAWVGVIAAFSFLIGFRYKVGGDWYSYQRIMINAVGVAFPKALFTLEPGYAALNWLSANIVNSIYFVNTICAMIFMVGIADFCLRQAHPALGLLISMPYMIIVMGMGYTRQSAAFGFELLALTMLSELNVLFGALFLVCGALFHKTVLVLLPILVIARSKSKILTVCVIIFIVLQVINSAVFSEYSLLVDNYLKRDRYSSGGVIRVAMNFVPAIIFIIFGRRLERNAAEQRLWLWMSIISIAAIPAVFFASTAVDRLALYLMPIQIYVITRIDRLFTEPLSALVFRILVVVYYGLVLVVWLNYGDNASSWLPYRVEPFID